MVGSMIRRAGFWFLDGLKGGPIRHHYEDIRSKMSNDHDSQEQLQRLLDHASRTTRFYSQYPANDLHALPVVTKSLYRNRFIDFQSTAYAGAPLHHVCTSGTSGVRFTMGHDRIKRSRAIAETIYFNEVCGQQVGDRLMWLRAWTPALTKSRMELLAQNIIPIGLINMDDRVRDDVVRTLRRQHVNCVLGYSSALWSLARFIDRSGYDSADFGLRVIISDAEALHLTIKRRIEAAFGCPVVDRYATAENGLLACTTPGDDLYRLNWASYHFEFLKLGKDEPEKAGCLARVVVTDLYNHAMPMIRYDTGDLAVVAHDDQGRPTTLRSIEGRHADVIYDTAGREISVTSIGSIMNDFAELEQYQLIQEGSSAYRLRVCGGESTYSAREFSARLSDALGADAQVSVEFVDSIPNECSGKFRSIVCGHVPVSESAPR
jgi:phenylacetate-CoA ligase